LANIYKTPTLNTNIFLPKETTTIRRNAHALRNNASSVSVELLGLGNLLAHVANVVLAGHRSLFFGGDLFGFHFAASRSVSRMGNVESYSASEPSRL
jgi:hypothetical protein